MKFANETESSRLRSGVPFDQETVVGLMLLLDGCGASCVCSNFNNLVSHLVFLFIIPPASYDI